VPALSLPSGNLVSVFKCPACGHDEAYSSRPRGMFEKFMLPLFMLRPVRCERCYRRSYALRSVHLLERRPARGRHNRSQPPGHPGDNSRIA
jgi:hypothetical protein